MLNHLHFGALVVLLGACTQANGRNVPPATLPARVAGLTVTPVLAPGDTLAYTVSWTAGARALAYDLVLSSAATNGAWSASYGTGPASGMPASATTTTLSTGLKLTAIPWDSATFTLSITSRNAAGNSLPATASWSVRRKPGPPGPPKVDSSATITGLLVQPDTIRFTARGQGRQACPFLQFANGVVAVAQGAVYHPLCDSLALRVFTAAQRAVTLPQQLCADSGGTYCATGLGQAREWSASLVAIAASGDTAWIAASYGLDRIPPFQLVALR